MSQILQVNDLHVYYGSIHAVKGVSFEVNEGEVVTLIGANGAGKSTVLNTVSGLLHPKHGSVVFEGKDLKGVSAHKIVERGMAQVPEGRHVFLQMTVEDNLEMGAYTQPNSTIDAGIADVYERFPRLKERRKQIAGTLSGGEQQMLAMGRALMSKPKLLMLDEQHRDLKGVADGADVFHQLGRFARVHAGGGLVKEQQAGVCGQCTQDFQSALRAVRQRACLGARKIFHVEDGEQLHRALVDHALLAPEARQAEDALGHVVVHLGVHGGDDVLLHREVLEQADVLEGTRDARAVDLRGVKPLNILAV